MLLMILSKTVKRPINNDCFDLMGRFVIM